MPDQYFSSRLDTIEARLDALEGRFDRMATRQDMLEARFDALDMTVGSISTQARSAAGPSWIDRLRDDRALR